MIRVSGRMLCAIRDSRNLTTGAKLLAIFLVVFPRMSMRDLASRYRSRASFFRDLATLREAGWVEASGLGFLVNPPGRPPAFQRAALSVLLLSDLSKAAIVVALMVRLRGGFDARKFRATLMADCSMSSRSITKALQELRRSGWLIRSVNGEGWELKLINLRLRGRARSP